MIVLQQLTWRACSFSFILQILSLSKEKNEVSLRSIEGLELKLLIGLLVHRENNCSSKLFASFLGSAIMILLGFFRSADYPGVDL